MSEVMNLDNRISNQTTLYGYIAIFASQNRLSHNFNKALKEQSIDGMMIPMNIREDDFYFTLSNMKKSHVNGTMLGVEYQQNILELLDSSSEMVQVCGGCDFVKRAGETLHGDFIGGEVVKEFLNAHQEIQKIAIIGDTPLARALALILKDTKIAFYDVEIERLLLMSQALYPNGTSHENIDINYLSPNGVDFSEYDLLIDATQENISANISKPAQKNLDLKDSKTFSSLKQFDNYIGFDQLLDFYTQHLIEDLKK